MTDEHISVPRSLLDRALKSAEVLAECVDDTVPHRSQVDRDLIADLKIALAQAREPVGHA